MLCDVETGALQMECLATFVPVAKHVFRRFDYLPTEYNNNIEFSRVVGHVFRGNDVRHVAMKLPFVSNRDWCTYRRLKLMPENDSYVL